MKPNLVHRAMFDQVLQERDRLRGHFDQLEKQIGLYRDFEYHPDCDEAWFISRVGYHIDKALHSTEEA